ncbi:hypothetical protein [Mesorhizobium sp.]|uniref:hypothetical protein n=1 Tax=Mesorhizobium sp. TaxID=1871066 RepID=UPI0025CF3E1C|nr:hypothetical protein [Mesorhizobium sp.]
MPIVQAASTVWPPAMRKPVDERHRIVAEQTVVSGCDSCAEIIVGGDPVRQAAPTPT